MKALEIGSFGAALFFGLKWLFDPQGPHEPYMAVCSLVLSMLAHIKSKQSPPPDAKESEREFAPLLDEPMPPEPPKQSLIDEFEELPRFPAGGTSAFFAERFAQAFPGVRKARWMSGQEAIDRLNLLLKPPLVFRTGDVGTVSPIWWIGRGNLQVESFRRISEDTVLMGTDELRINHIVAVPGDAYWQSFVYLEAAPGKATGLYPRTAEQFDECRSTFGYVWEEFGLVDGHRAVSRAEYDDGAAEINGEVVNIRARCELRTRYLTPYNLIVCAHAHPLVMGSSYDEELKSWLNSLLQEPAEFHQFEEWVLQLPKVQRFS